MSEGITIKKRTLYIILAIVIIAAGSISAYFFLFRGVNQQTTTSEKAAIVNGETITKQELNSYYNSLSQQQKQQITKSQLLDSLIQNELLVQEAKNSNIKINESQINKQVQQMEMMASLRGASLADILKQRNMSEQEFKDALKERLLIQKYVNKTLNVSATEQEIENYYNNNKQQFQIPEQVNASHILANTTQQAEAALIALENKAFAEVAKEYSIGSSASQGGNLGLFSRNQMVQNFSDAAFNLSIGEVSNIVKTSYGYHIIKVHQKKDARTQTLNESREQIKTVLQQQKQQSALQLLLQQLMQKADIQKFI